MGVEAKRIASKIQRSVHRQPAGRVYSAQATMNKPVPVVIELEVAHLDLPSGESTIATANTRAAPAITAANSTSCMSVDPILCVPRCRCDKSFVAACMGTGSG